MTDLEKRQMECYTRKVMIKSNRVQKKCGFKYQWKSESMDVTLMHEKRIWHVSVMTREDLLSGR